jgi:nucleoside-diphosphate kinase
MIERTFVMIKPDGVRRSLVGKIISTFERAGLRIIALEMRKPDRELVFKHYPESTEWLSEVGEKTVKGYKDMGLDVTDEFGTEDGVAIGRMVKEWLMDFISSGEVVAMVLEGNAAVINVRRLCGGTFPIFADPGSIRGRYGLESPEFGNVEKRPVENLVHASGKIEDAKYEISLWFPDLSEPG